MDILLAYGIWWILVVIYAIILLMLPFFVLRIRREAISIARDVRRMLDLMEAVVPESKKPKPPPVPKTIYNGERMVRVCPSCEQQNEMQDAACAKCGAKLL